MPGGKEELEGFLVPEDGDPRQGGVALRRGVRIAHIRPLD